MPENFPVMDARNATKIKICVDSLHETEPVGRLVSQFRKESMDFVGIISMVNQIDAFLTQINFPKAYNQQRSFQGKENTRNIPNTNREVVEYMSSDAFETKLGERLTFVITVQFRQNSTWQGTITWTEQKKTQNFRSTLEMIKLMDSAMEAESKGDFLAWN